MKPMPESNMISHKYQHNMQRSKNMRPQEKENCCFSRWPCPRNRQRRENTKKERDALLAQPKEPPGSADDGTSPAAGAYKTDLIPIRTHPPLVWLAGFSWQPMILLWCISSHLDGQATGMLIDIDMQLSILWLFHKAWFVRMDDISYAHHGKTIFTNDLWSWKRTCQIF